jgi:hypothetical protein
MLIDGQQILLTLSLVRRGVPDLSSTCLVKIYPSRAGVAVDPTVKPAAVGWEKNPEGKLGPRVADLVPMTELTR